MSNLYAPLTDSKDNIRLLSIITDPIDTHVTCKLTTTSLSSHPRYTALSYFWGDPKVTEDILVNGRVRSVTTTLATALRHIAKHWTSVYPDEERRSLHLWADAICIDQDSDLEKNHQVNLMGEIYRRAEMVIAWLGVSGQIDNGLANLQLLAKEIEMSGRHDLLRLEWLCRFPNLCVDDIGPDDPASPIRNTSWREIIGLFDLPYWERVWILQEAAFAKQILFCTDNVNLAYSDMLTVWQKLSAVKVDIRQGLVVCPRQLSGSSVWPLLATDFFDWVSIRRLNEIRVHLASLTQQPNRHAGAQSSQLSLSACRLKASNPKDHIYGLRDLADLGIEVDYSHSKSVKDVYCDYVSALLVLVRATTACPKHKTPELFFLRSAGIGLFENSLGLPTYAPNFPEESNAQLLSRSFMGHADSRFFHAEGLLARIEDASLAVPGVRVDTIPRVEAAPAEHTWYDGTCLKYCQDYVARAHHAGRGFSPLRTIVQTLRLDADEQIDGHFMDYALYVLLVLISGDAENIDAHFSALGLAPPADGENGSRFNQSFIRALCPDWTGPTHAWRDMLFQERGSKLYEVAFDVALLHERWRFFETTTGFMGLAPLKTQPGDLVFVLKESDVPVILRKQEDHYVFVGVCFVLDLMSGSLVAEKVRTGELVIEQIRIL